MAFNEKDSSTGKEMQEEALPSKKKTYTKNLPSRRAEEKPMLTE